MAAPLPSGLLTDPHQAAPASQRSGCLHAPFSDCSLLPICKTLPGIIACLFQLDFIPAFEKKRFSVVKSQFWGHQAWVTILLTYRPVVGLWQVMTLGFSTSNSKIRIMQQPPGTIVKIKLGWALGKCSVNGSGFSGNPLQYSCLEKPMDTEAWWGTVRSS